MDSEPSRADQVNHVISITALKLVTEAREEYFLLHLTFLVEFKEVEFEQGSC